MRICKISIGIKANLNVSLAISVISLAEFPSVHGDSWQAAYELYLSLVLSCFSLSLAENALVTGLIIFKILTVYRDIRGLGSRVAYPNGLGRNIVPILSILIESGVITFMVQLVQILMYKFDLTAYPIICGLVVQLYVRGSSSYSIAASVLMFFTYIYPIMQGISTAIVIVRVELLKYDEANKTSNTDMQFTSCSNNDNRDSLP